MHTIFTAPMEIFSPLYDGMYESEPYEVGWASEALAMVYVVETGSENARLQLRAQISADGQRWIDHGAALPTISSTGGYALTIGHFGNWLRLVGEIAGGAQGSPTFVVDFYWVLKG